jgi:hypothetical protein
LKPKRKDSDEADCREEVPGQFVVTRCYAPEILEPAKAALDNITILIGLLVVADFLLTVRFAGDDGFDPAVLKEFAERVAVVAFVRQKLGDAGGLGSRMAPP